MLDLEPWAPSPRHYVDKCTTHEIPPRVHLLV